MAKIAFLSTMVAYPWGGSEELWCRTAARLAREGRHAVHASVAWWPEPAPRLQELAAAGGLVRPRRMRHRLNALLGGALERAQYDWLKLVRPDLLVLSLGCQNEGADWMERCALLGVPYAVIVQAVSPRIWLDDAGAERMARAFEGARAVFCVSQGNAEMLRVHWATPLPRATVVRNPFNVRYDAADDLPWPPPAADGVIRMACVGRLDSVSKGQDILFEVLRREKWRARPLRVSLFGRGTQERILRALRERYRLDGVEFAGHVADIEQVWKTHHALVLPSREEGLPLAAVEAMLCARPCVVTGVAGNAEIVSDGVTGFVAASADVCALDAAMERAWERRAEWESMGRAAARRIRELVPPDPVADFARQVEALL